MEKRIQLTTRTAFKLISRGDGYLKVVVKEFPPQG